MFTFFIFFKKNLIKLLSQPCHSPPFCTVLAIFFSSKWPFYHNFQYCFNLFKFGLFHKIYIYLHGHIWVSFCRTGKMAVSGSRGPREEVKKRKFIKI